MRKINIIAATILLLLVGYIVSHSYSGVKPESNIKITIDDQSFSEDHAVVPLGGSVTWINNGKEEHWPASNPHPVHTLYPEEGGCIGSKLDSCRGLLNGEEYSFQFNHIGIWPIHDHLFPGLVMVVEVVSEKDYSQKTKDAGNTEVVSVSEFRNLDYGKQMDIVKSLANEDPARAWNYLKEGFIVNGEVLGNAHEFAHIIGNKSYEKFGIEGVKVCDDTFAFGCFHGVTEAMLLKEGLGSVRSVELECLRLFPPEKSQNYTGCIHGSGHGLYSWEKGNLKRALLDCDIISQPYRQYCYDGVFMENSNFPESKIFDQKNPWKFCTDLDMRYHRNCARYQSHIFLNMPEMNKNLQSVGGNCQKGPSTLLKETCYESLGYYVAQTNLGKVETIWNSCKMMPTPDGVAICIIGASKENIFQQYAGFEKSSTELCRKLDEPRKSECINNINGK